ncbi:MAG: hypothetical protein ABIJ97_12865 [Bacteroidota bacterium]
MKRILNKMNFDFDNFWIKKMKNICFPNKMSCGANFGAKKKTGFLTGL